MKKIIYSLVVLFSLISTQTKAQLPWYESFGNACSSGLGANLTAPSINGAWNVTSLATAPFNGTDANEWYISATEQGQLPGNCSGVGCGGTQNRSLHIGENQAAPSVVDQAASYITSATSNTNKRAESPPIATTGFSNITVSFNYLVRGLPGTDECELFYFDGTWNSLGVLAPTSPAACPTPTAQATWQLFSIGLPASCNNIGNLQIGFVWRNSSVSASGSNPSIAIDDIRVEAMSLNSMSVVPCPQQTVVATASTLPQGITSFTWGALPVASGITFNPATGASPTTAVTYPAGGGTYTLIVLGSTCPTCAASATAITTVTVNSVLSLTVAPLSQTICPTASAVISATGATTYTWNINAGPVIGTGPSVTVTSAVAGNSVYSVQGTLGMCLSNSVLATVIYSNAALPMTITPQSPSVCPTGSISLTTSGANNYTWTSGYTPTLTGAGNTFTDGPLANIGTYVYTVTGETNGCTGMDTVTVYVQNIPFTLTIVPNQPTICAGQGIILTVNGGNNYTWTPFSTLSSSVGPNVTASPTITTTYNIFAENNGCTTNTAITVTVVPGPNILINTTSNAVCAGYTSTLTASGGMSYVWTGSTFSNTIAQPSISMGAGCYTVIATSTAYACPSLKSVCIASMAPLQIGVSQSSYTTCIANNSPKFSLPVTLNANGGSTYNWAPCVGGFLSICIGNSVIARPQTTTQYTVTGFTSVCSGTHVITVTVVPQSTLNVQPPMPIACLGGCFNFTVINTNSTLPQPYTYSWSVPNSVVGSIQGGGILAPLATACPTTSATYSVEMKDFRNCVTEQRLVHTTIIPQPLTCAQIPTINGVPTNSVCFVGDIVDITTNTLTLCAVNCNGTLMPGVTPSYTWFSASVPSNSMMNEGSIKTPTSDPCVIISPVTKLPSPITYTLYSGFNGNGGSDQINGCFREDTISIRVVDCRRVTAVTFTTVVLNDTICTKQCVTFTNTTDAGGPQYVKWQFPGGAPSTSTLQAPTVCYNLPGKFNVFLTDSNQYGPPVATGTFQFVKVVDVPNTTIISPGMTRSDTTIRFGMAVDLKGTGAVSYDWSPPYMISNLHGAKTTVYPHQTNMYILTGCNSRGCCSNDTINVVVIDDCGEMFVPNAFSPNGRDDAENETLKVYGYCLESLTFQVFNRWGQKVWETTDQTIGWDGTFNGEPLNTGVFVYRLEGKDYKGKGYSVKGNVSLIR
jgi:gliding motility-associated-like protein